MEPKKACYFEKIEWLKRLLESMKEIEESYAILEDLLDTEIISIKWITQEAEIKINEIDSVNELFQITISVWPKKSKGKKFRKKEIYYFYTIEREEVEREISFWPHLPSLKQSKKERKKILDEIFSILCSDELTIKTEKRTKK